VRKGLFTDGEDGFDGLESEPSADGGGELLGVRLGREAGKEGGREGGKEGKGGEWSVR